MTEYIKREDAVKAAFDCTDSYEPPIVDTTVKLVAIRIQQLPSADVQPVKHGEWTAEGNDEKGNYWDECTVCRDAVWFPPFVKNDYKYCPHCGARMDGEEDG